MSEAAPLLSLTEKTSGSSTTEMELGDVVLRAGAVLLAATSAGSSVNGSAAMKLPTADEAKGLGTGQTDYGAFPLPAVL